MSIANGDREKERGEGGLASPPFDDTELLDTAVDDLWTSLFELLA